MKRRKRIMTEIKNPPPKNAVAPFNNDGLKVKRFDKHKKGTGFLYSF